MACFTALATLKAALSITDVNQDVLLQVIVDSVNSELLNFFYLTDCAPTQYTNFYDVLDSTSFIWLQEYPVISIDTVTIGGTVQDPSTYYLDARVGSMGAMKRKGMSTPAISWEWPTGPRAVEVTHTAGWAGGEPDVALQNAATLLATYSFNTGPKLGYEEEHIGQYSYKLGSAARGSGVGFGGAESGGLPGPVARILANYHRIFAEGN